ncbi:U-box domain-containing protein 17-like [Phoenix dactylifera]|uniref:RING-type E3 ubiquitin transferase n=1 Tax=Phoenix dactylifera TaxID=42345 RepID=A0A8B7C232_PHODC|nr:U-box domain-containing protein 17-like [Phoenix dactylifera]
MAVDEMSSALAFLSIRRRRLPVAGAFFAPADFSDLALIHILASLARELVTSHYSPHAQFQRRNSRSLVRKVKILLCLFEFLKDSLSSSSSPPRRPPPFPRSAILCFRELYILVFRAKLLLEYCSQSSRLWLLLRNPQISGNFHDLNQEMATLLDVLPLDALHLSADVREQIELLQRQTRRSKLYVHPQDEDLRRKLFSFLNEFEQGEAPDAEELRAAFVDQLGIRDATDCRTEIEFLEEQIYNQEEDADFAILGGVVALTRYCRFLLFGFQEIDVERCSNQARKLSKGLPSQGSLDSSFTIPKDFCCPISLDLMRDPVITSTGQTYDRASITQWIDEGHYTCPNSGLMLAHNLLVPNRALRTLISQWCSAHGIPYDTPESAEASAESIATACSSKAAVEANRATATILVRQLSTGSEDERTVSVRELRLLAKTGRENRAFIAETGAIPLLSKLLCTWNPVAQENAVTAILNLSIHDVNKSRIMDEEGCLRLIVSVLRQGWTTEARENAAATLFSLSAVHEHKKTILDEPGAVEALARMLTDGRPRGRKDAVMALFNLSTHPESWVRMMDMGAVSALVGAVEDEGVAEEAAGALALLLKQPIVAEVVGSEEAAINSLLGLMRMGTAKGKENAVAALQELCQRGGFVLTQRVARMPSLGALLHTILFTGTKRARRKAALLAKICQRCASPAAMALGSGWAIDRTSAMTNDSLRRSSSFGSGEVSVSVPVPISVHAI